MTQGANHTQHQSPESARKARPESLGQRAGSRSMDVGPGVFTRSVKETMRNSRFKRKNPYQCEPDLTSQKLIKSNQISLESQLQLLKEIKEGRPRKSQEQVVKENPIRMKHVRVCSQELQVLPKKSPFAAGPYDPKDYMKAVMVNNNIFHGDFDPSLTEPNNLKAATELLGVQEANRLGQVTEVYDKRYFQKYPKQKEKLRAQEAMKRKAFKQQCRSLYSQRRMKLENSIVKSREYMDKIELQGFFDREQLLSGKVQSPVQENCPVDKDQMAQLLDEYRDKMFPHHKLSDFLPPHELTKNDVLQLMELTGKIKQGEKAYEPFAEYLKQRKIFEDKFNEWNGKKTGQRRKFSPKQPKVVNVDLPSKGSRQRGNSPLSDDSIARDDSILLSPASGFLASGIGNFSMSAMQKQNVTADFRKNARKQRGQARQSPQQIVMGDTMFSKNFEATPRDDQLSIHHAEKSIQSYREMQQSATQPSQPTPRDTKLSSTRKMLSKTQKAAARKQQFKLPRKSKLPLPHEMASNKLSPVRENENIKKFAQLKIPFMSRNNTSHCSYTKMSSNAPTSTGDMDPFLLSPTMLDSNYISSVTSVARGGLQSRSTMAMRPNQQRSDSPAKRASFPHNRPVITSPPHISSPTSVSQARKNLRTAEKSFEGANSYLGSPFARVQVPQHHTRLNSQGSPRVIREGGSVSGLRAQSFAPIPAANKSRFDAQSAASGMLSLRKLSLMEECPPNRFIQDHYSQLDNLMEECGQAVPYLIGKIRKTRKTKDGIIVPKGYRTRELIGKEASKQLKERISKNQSILRVLEESKLQEAVDDILLQKKRAATIKAATKIVTEGVTAVEETTTAEPAPADKLEIEAQIKIANDHIGELKEKDSIVGSDSDDFDSVELQQEVRLPPAAVVVQLRSKHFRKIMKKSIDSNPLDKLLSNVELEKALERDNFAEREVMKEYVNEDYRIKAFLMLITATDKTKIWMPTKTVFDKKGGKFSDKVGGLGQIPGL